MTEQEIKTIGAAIDKELTASGMSGAMKEALTVRIIDNVKESNTKGVIGLDTLKDKGGSLEITLSNGLRIKADALT